MSQTPLFNPLDKHNLGKSVVDALLERPVQSLGMSRDFMGAGVYAIYYNGDFPLYKPLAKLNRRQPLFPIYVGKAVPSGSRKGGLQNASASSHALAGRLSEHAESIEHADNLAIEDFQYRHLAVDDIWITLGETLLIQRYEPLWNQIVEGFGNHDPGRGRYKGQRPAWDELHPGRAWAAKCAPAKYGKGQIEESVRSWMEARLPSLS
jgi:hypothetical protein